MSSTKDYLEQGKSHFSQGEYKLALEYFQAASEADPKCKDAYLLQATVHQVMGDDRLAQSAIYGILMANPTDTDAAKYLQMISNGNSLELAAGVLGYVAELLKKAGVPNGVQIITK